MRSTAMTSKRSWRPLATNVSSNRLAGLIRGAQRFVGKGGVREGLAARFAGIPDVHYGDDEHFACGNRGVSEWTLTGTTTDGERIEVRGCDLWTFDAENKIGRKDSFWKIRQS